MYDLSILTFSLTWKDPVCLVPGGVEVEVVISLLSDDGAAAGLDSALGARHAMDIHHDLQVVFLSPLVDPVHRMEHSHWSRSTEKLCFDWLISRCRYSSLMPLRHSSRHFLPLVLYSWHKDRWLPCRKRIYYRRLCQQYNDPTRNMYYIVWCLNKIP